MDLWINGRPADQIGHYSALTRTTRYGEGSCGNFEATWQMSLPAGYDHPDLRRGAIVQLRDGMIQVGSSLILGEPNRGGIDQPWKFTAAGVGREAERDNGYYCLDASGNMTSRPDVAVDRAMDRGLPWAGRDATIPTTPLTDTPTELNTVGACLNSAADEQGKRWGLGNDDVVRFFADPTNPQWYLEVGPDALSPGDDDYASTILLRHKTTTGGYDTVTATNAVTDQVFGHREFPADVTSLGPMTTARAQDFADGLLAKGKGRMGWVNGLEIAEGALTTPGGGLVDLSLVEAGQMVRLVGMVDQLLPYTGQTWLDVMLSEVRYESGARKVPVAPMGILDRRMATVLESALGKKAA